MSVCRSRACAVLFAALFGALAIQPALAATSKTGAPRLPAKVSFIDAPSAESPQAREKRLKRECRGRPNAGMCLGHTQ